MGQQDIHTNALLESLDPFQDPHQRRQALNPLMNEIRRQRQQARRNRALVQLPV